MTTPILINRLPVMGSPVPARSPSVQEVHTSGALSTWKAPLLLSALVAGGCSTEEAATVPLAFLSVYNVVIAYRNYIDPKMRFKRDYSDSIRDYKKIATGPAGVGLIGADRKSDELLKLFGENRARRVIAVSGSEGSGRDSEILSFVRNVGEGKNRLFPANTGVVELVLEHLCSVEQFLNFARDVKKTSTKRKIIIHFNPDVITMLPPHGNEAHTLSGARLQSLFADFFREVVRDKLDIYFIAKTTAGNSEELRKMLPKTGTADFAQTFWFKPVTHFLPGEWRELIKKKSSETLAPEVVDHLLTLASQPAVTPRIVLNALDEMFLFMRTEKFVQSPNAEAKAGLLNALVDELLKANSRDHKPSLVLASNE